MQRDVSDVDGIYPSYMTGETSVFLIEWDHEVHGHAQMSQYEILSSFDLVSLLGVQDLDWSEDDTVYASHWPI